MGILRLSHVDVTVTDLDLATAYYTEVMGMLVTARDDNAVYLKCWDEEDHHSLKLVYAPRVGFEKMSFKVEREDDLSDLENAVAKYGFPVERISRGESIGQGESIRFQTPSGHVMELVHDVEVVGSERLDHHTGPMLVISNHILHLDVAMLMSTFPTPLRERMVIAAAADTIFAYRWRGIAKGCS